MATVVRLALSARLCIIWSRIADVLDRVEMEDVTAKRLGGKRAVQNSGQARLGASHAYQTFLQD